MAVDRPILYGGEDEENLLLKLLNAADFDIEAAQRDVLSIDEIDTIGKTSHKGEAGLAELLPQVDSDDILQDPMDKHGGHPLANRRATRADLLEQPDWGAPPPKPDPRPQAEQMPARRHVAPGADRLPHDCKFVPQVSQSH